MESIQDMSQRALSKRIMRRVYLIAGIRFVLNPVFVKSLIAVVLFVRTMKYVSYGNVIANMPSPADISGGYQFVRAALFHTNPMTVILLSSVVWLAVWATFDMWKKDQEAWI